MTQNEEIRPAGGPGGLHEKTLGNNVTQDRRNVQMGGAV